MTSDAQSLALAAVIDTLALLQAQLDRVERSTGRVEAQQREILGRLDTIDTAQAEVTDLMPVLEMILARSIEDRDSTNAKLARIAQLAAFAHAAALGNRAPLPVEAADDRLLEQFLLTQPADLTSTLPALMGWRAAAGAASSVELFDLLTRQYQPSPTDTPETRVLRYQLAAISRAELQGRGAVLPPPPPSTMAQDRSLEARQSRSAELARVWRGGECSALFADPELAGALALFDDAERRGRGAPEEQLSAALAEIHRKLGDRLAAGQRPSSVEQRDGDPLNPSTEVEPDRPR